MTFLSKFSFFGSAWAMAGSGQGGEEGANPMASLFPLLAMVLIIYFLLIRPQTKRTKQHQQMLGSLKRGDMIVTKGGVFGKITEIRENVITIEIAEKVRVRIAKDAVSGVTESAEGKEKEGNKGK